MFKRFLKIFGISVGAIVGVVAIAIGGYAIFGGFNQVKIGMTKVFFDSETDTERRMIIEDDLAVTVNYLPTDATETTLKTIVSGDTNIIDIPSTVQGGKEFTIKLRKTLNNRNVGGNVTIEFVSADKNSESNLTSPCKLQLTVDVPVENNDLFFASDLRYISSSTSFNQRIIAKNKTSTTFYLRSNKDNIFDINQWSKEENKITYFYYEENGIVTPITIDDNDPRVVNCTYDKTKDEYALMFYPDRTNETILKVIAKVHRSYQIQQEYINGQFYKLEEYANDRLILTENELSSLISAYNDFLEKYYRDYFAKGNADAMKFFSEDNSTNNKVHFNYLDTEIKQKIKTSLNYVFVSTNIEFYISDVKVKKFSVTNTPIELSLVKIDSVTGELNRTENYYIENASTNGEYLAQKFGFAIQGTNLSGMGEISNEAILDLYNQIEISVLVFDKSGLSKTSKQSFVVNANSTYNFKDVIEGYETDKFGINSQYLTITKSDKMADNNYMWTIEKKVPSKVSEFQIYLMFTLEVNDEDGLKTFYDFAKVNIVEDSDTANDGVSMNTNITFGVNEESSSVIYVTEDDVVKTALNEKGYTPNTKSLMTSHGYSNVTFNNFKLFAYLGSTNATSINEFNQYSVMTKSLFSNSVYYNILDLDTSRICTFTNLTGSYLRSRIDDDTKKLVTNFGNDNEIVYAYELNYQDLQNINTYSLTYPRKYTINALNASQNEIALFGCYVLTDKDNNPINREGVRLFTNDNKLNIYDVDNNQEGLDFSTISINGIDTTIVNYISLNEISLSSSNHIQVKSILENLYYYTNMSDNIKIKIGEDENGNPVYNNYDADTYIQRNGNLKTFGNIKLLKSNEYKDFITILPFSFDDYNTLKTAKAEEVENLHKKLTNAILALNDAKNYSSLHEFGFEVRVSNTETNDDVKLTKITNIELDGTEFIYQIILTLLGDKVTDPAKTPYIAVSKDFANDYVYIPSDTVSLEVNDIAVTNIDNLYNSDGNILQNTYDISGRVKADSTGYWTWDSSLYHASGDTSAKMMYIFNNENENAFITSISENIITNILQGLILDNNTYVFDSTSAIVDISNISNDYLLQAICKYIFNIPADYNWTNIHDFYTALLTKINNNKDVNNQFEEIYNLSNVRFSTENTSCAEGNIYVDILDMYILEDGYSIKYDQSTLKIVNGVIELDINNLPIGYLKETDSLGVLRIYKANGEDKILIATKVKNISEYFTNGSLLDSGVYRAKLNEDGSLPLSDIQGHYGIAFKTLWEFNGTNTFSKENYFTVDAIFEAPTFKFVDDGNVLTQEITLDKDNRSISLDLFYAYYGDTASKDLKDKIKITIQDSNYAYFLIGESTKTYEITGVNTPLQVYDCFEDRNVSVKCSLAGKDLYLNISIEANLTFTTTLNSNSKFYHYVDPSDIGYTSGNSKITINSKDISTGTSYTIEDNTIRYNLTDLFTLNNTNTGYSITAVDGSKYYLDLNTNKKNLDSTLGDLINIETNKLVLKNNIYTTMMISFKVSFDNLNLSPVENIADTIYTITIDPIIKVSKSNQLLSKMSEKYYQYQTTYNTIELLENGKDLNEIIGLKVLNYNETTNALEYIDYSQIGDFSLFETQKEYMYYTMGNKTYDIHKQFVNYDDNSQTNLGKIYQNCVSFEDDKLNLKIIDQSYILPVRYSLNGFFGITEKDASNHYILDMLLPVAGYNIKNIDKNRVYGYDYANNKFETISLDFVAGNVYDMLDYLTIYYASSEVFSDLFVSSPVTSTTAILHYAINNSGLSNTEVQDIAIDGTSYGTLKEFQQIILKDYYSTIDKQIQIYLFEYLINASSLGSATDKKVVLNDYNLASGIDGVEITINIKPTDKIVWNNVSSIISTEKFSTSGVNIASTYTDVATWLTSEFISFILNDSSNPYTCYATEFTIDNGLNTSTIIFRELDASGNQVMGNYIQFKFDTITFDTSGNFVSDIEKTNIVITIKDASGNEKTLDILVLNGRQ